MFGINMSADIVRCPVCLPKRVANALMGFQLRSACGGECSLLFERALCLKPGVNLFILRDAQCSMNIVIRIIHFVCYIS